MKQILSNARNENQQKASLLSKTVRLRWRIIVYIKEKKVKRAPTWRGEVSIIKIIMKCFCSFFCYASSLSCSFYFFFCLFPIPHYWIVIALNSEFWPLSLASVANTSSGSCTLRKWVLFGLVLVLIGYTKPTVSLTFLVLETYRKTRQKLFQSLQIRLLSLNKSRERDHSSSQSSLRRTFHRSRSWPAVSLCSCHSLSTITVRSFHWVCWLFSRLILLLCFYPHFQSSCYGHSPWRRFAAWEAVCRLPLKGWRLD